MKLKKLTIFNVLLVIFSILFFVIFFYFISTIDNKLIKYRVIKTPYESEEYEKVNYEELSDKYKFKKCKDMCKSEFCCEYDTQKIKFDLCKECKKENKCYDPLEGICVKCKDNYTCEQLFGCGNKPPINPLNNYCTRCWIK